jgi:hypothetical protein
MLWIEGAVAAAIALAFFVASFFMFKPEHVEHHPLRVRIGALIQGATIGLIIGFVIVPLRMSLMSSAGFDGAASPGMSSLSFVPAIGLLIAVRRGVLLRAPLISRFMRAYRRAMLLRTRDHAIKQLGKLDVIEGRKAAAA